MKILQRYILDELKLPFMLCFLILNFIFMAGYLVRAANFIIGRNIPLWDTLMVLILALPEMVSYTAPMSILTAVLIAFGGLSQNNEIRAMKASGIHPLMIMTPVLLAGLVLSFGMFVFNDQVATKSSFEVRRMTKKMLIKHPSAIIEPGRFVKLSENIVFLAKRLEKNQMRDIVAYESEDATKPIRTIIAERGEIVSNKDNSELQIRLYDGSVSDTEDSSVQSIQFKSYEFPTIGQEDIRKMRKKTRDLTLAELLIRAGAEALSPKDRKEVWTWFHQRIAFAFGCFIFVFIGIPIAILVQRGEVVLSFAVSMIATSLYYIFFVGAKTLATQGVLPTYLAFWLPNIILFAAGWRLLKKAVAS